VLLVVLPKGGGPYAKVASDGRLVPKDTVCDSVRLGRVVQDQALVVFSARVHHLAKLIKVWENSKKCLVKVLTILTDIVSKRKDVIDIGSNHGGHVHTVLGRHHEENLPVASIHEKLANNRVSHERFVIHTIIHEDKDWRAPPDSQKLLLTFYEFLESVSVIVPKDEEIRNELFIVSVAFFCSRHGNTRWQVLLVPQNISHKSRFARPTFPYEDAHLVVPHF
jgi:hypothetical protein